MLGRHFLVYSEKAPRVKRQYTICSSMGTEVRAALLELARSAGKRDIEFNYRIMLGQDTSSIDLTLKTYGVAKGLATRIHQSQVINKAQVGEEGKSEFKDDSVYFIKGPMGRGLQMQPSGLHVAFCAGTGVLVFLDLVAHLLILNVFNATGRDLPEEMSRFYQPGFKLHLYVSF